MTNDELQRLSRMLAGDLMEAFKNDNEIIDVVFPPKFMNIEQAALFTGLPISTIYSKVKEIPHSKCGRRLIFSDRDLTRWIRKGL
jgi:hypothetical protein